MTESESVALPLGDAPILNTRYYNRDTLFLSRVFWKILLFSAFFKRPSSTVCQAPRVLCASCRKAGGNFFKNALSSAPLVWYNMPCSSWARSSAGRALRSQRRGRGFDPLRVHQRQVAAPNHRGNTALCQASSHHGGG